MTRRRILLAALWLLAGCTGVGSPRPPEAPAAFLGVYRGSFGSAHTEDPADDVNYNPCDPARERCLGGAEPLVDVVLELRPGPDGRTQLGFFRSPEDRARGVELDLLGHGCATSIGPMRSLSGPDDSGRSIAVFPLSAANRLCLNKLRPTSTHEIRVELGKEPESGLPIAQVLIDKEVRSTNYLYVVEDGKQRRVRIEPDKAVDTADGRRYRVCIEDDLGEYVNCVLTDRELRRFVLPVPLPGGAALSYTWWYELTPKLERTRGLYELEQYSGRFVRVGSAGHDQ